MKKHLSTSRRKMAAGLKPVQLWLTREQHDRIFQAAERDGRAATQFLIHHGLRAAKRISGNHDEAP